MSAIKPTEATARAVLEVLKHGLSRGLGKPKPGQMCVEAAVCYAMGLPHSDNPPCVGAAVRSFKIALNDKDWSSPMARAAGMRRLAIAQLGSNEIDQNLFVKEIVLAAVRLMVPIALRAAAKRNPSRAEVYEEHAVKCVASKDLKDGCANARAAYAAAYAAADAYAYAAATAAAAASAAADAAASAAAAAYASAAADAAAYAAAYAAAAADARDEVLSIMAEAGVQALIVCKSPGCEWLPLAEAAQ